MLRFASLLPVDIIRDYLWLNDLGSRFDHFDKSIETFDEDSNTPMYFTTKYHVSDRSRKYLARIRLSYRSFAPRLKTHSSTTVRETHVKKRT